MLFLGESQGVYGIMYADRLDGSSQFGVAHFVDGAPLARSVDLRYPFMTADCGRLYFTGLGQILYLNLSY